MGFNAGIMADVPVGKDFSFQPGLSFLQKGGKTSESFFGATISSTTSLNYLELPLNFVYKIKSKTGSFLIGAGPCMSYALSGKNKVTDGSGNTESHNIKFGSSDSSDLKRFEFSGNILAGYEFAGGFFASINYNIGLSNLDPQGGTKAKNYYAGLRIGYLLPMKGKKK